MRRLVLNLSRPLCNRDLCLISPWKETAVSSLVMPRLCHRQVYCTTTEMPPSLQLTEEEKRLGKRKSLELEATRILENLSGEEKMKLESLKLEYETMKVQMQMVPKVVRNQDWVKLVNLETASSRRTYYKYRTQVEMKQFHKKHKKEVKKLSLESTQQDTDAERINTIIAHVSHKKMGRSVGREKACQSMLFGNPFVFDFKVGEQKPREIKHVLTQIDVCYGANKKHIEPFHMHFTGVPLSGPLVEEMKWKKLDRYFIDIHEQDIHKVFPRDKLVYLTPQSYDDLDYNPDNIYVMGALVDIYDTKPYTAAKAKTLKLKTARLPLNKFYRLKKTQSLPLDIVYQVMLDINLHGDIEKAMLHIPERYWTAPKTRRLTQLWKEKIEKQENDRQDAKVLGQKITKEEMQQYVGERENTTEIENYQEVSSNRA